MNIIFEKYQATAVCGETHVELVGKEEDLEKAVARSFVAQKSSVIKIGAIRHARSYVMAKRGAR